MPLSNKPHADTVEEAEIIAEAPTPTDSTPEVNTAHMGLPVSGYTAQSDTKVALVNVNKTLEECVLRQIDLLAQIEDIDPRWLAMGRSSIESGFMAINRSIFQPGRIALPGDEAQKSTDEADA